MRSSLMAVHFSPGKATMDVLLLLSLDHRGIRYYNKLLLLLLFNNIIAVDYRQ